MKKIIVGIIAILMMITMLTGCNGEEHFIKRTARVVSEDYVEVTEREYDENGNMIRQDWYVTTWDEFRN